MILNHEWVSRQEASDESRRDYERERLVLWTLDALAEQMREAELSKADLARKLGTSRAHVTQTFSGSRNATLATVSDLAWACGKRAVVRFEPLRSGQFISQPAMSVSTRTKVVQMKSNGQSYESPVDLVVGA